MSTAKIFRPVREGKLTAEARVVRAGSTLGYVECDVKDANGKLVATQHDIRAGLYAPLRLLIYEDEKEKTCVEYDKPSSQFGQFGNANVTEVAAMLDRKLEQLVAEVMQ